MTPSSPDAARAETFEIVRETAAPRAQADSPDLYDARRRRHYTKPVLRGWLHLISFEASLVVGTLLIASTHGATHIAAASVYAASVSGLFGASALYHRGNWNALWSRRLQRLDHTMIFALIAGSATPAFIVNTSGTYRLTCVATIWTLGIAAATVRSLTVRVPEAVAGAMFLGLGWAGALAVPPVWRHSGVVPAVLIIVGGLLYTTGAISYQRRRPDPVPSVFGYHEVFHVYVLAGAACQYVAIAIYIL